jgi:lysophospholipase L1-like esterase
MLRSLCVVLVTLSGIASAQKFSGESLQAAMEPSGGPDQPRYFSMPISGEGNFRVTVTLGSPDVDSITTVKAELRRLMVEAVPTPKGRYETRSFLVNIRTPKIARAGDSAENKVRLKPREINSEARAWDDRLTLEFIGVNPSVSSIEIERAENVPTIFIAGDSTSTDQPTEPFNSWGQMLTRFLKPEIAVANNGESGESLRSFIGERRLAKVMSQIGKGDFLIVQMGHNDQKERGDGVGAFTTYKADLKRFIAEARQREATPLLVTPMNRLTFDADGKVTNSLGDYPEAVRQTGREEHVPVIDLNAMSKPLYEALGRDDAHLLFAGKDTTHHSDFGSYQLAKCIVEAMREQNLPLAKYVVDGLPRYDPAHPDTYSGFAVPAEPSAAGQKPYGN